MGKEISTELEQIMDYLSKAFARSINSSVYSKEDLHNDLVIVYLEKSEPDESIQGTRQYRNFWFKVFKNYLISKYRSVLIEKKLLEKIKKEKIFNKTTFAIKQVFNI